jgi:hypothetical protein
MKECMKKVPNQSGCKPIELSTITPATDSPFPKPGIHIDHEIAPRIDGQAPAPV